MELTRPPYWAVRNFISYLLWPVSLLFRLVSYLRKWCYQIGLLSRWRSPVPVIIVGNITVGGAGKSPLVIALTELLLTKSLSVGIVARGYGGDSVNDPVLVSSDSEPSNVGDECVMLAQRTGVPVVACADRVRAVKHLLSVATPDVVICDDGMQHYRLQRDLEIAVIDASYGVGNGFCLPAGPLREPESRLQSVNMIVHSGSDRTMPGYTLHGADAVSLADETRRVPLASFQTSQVHALAGIAAPERFFGFLRAQGLQVIEHPRSDHSVYAKDDFLFDDDLAVLMTEKDRVKVREHKLDNCWYVPVTARLDDKIVEEFLMHIQRVVLKSVTDGR